MKLIAPHYYPDFRCIADRCRHSCCIGWEIDIDPETRARYRSIPGAFGQRLNAAIEDGEDGAFFRLDADERCPMLNASGLCDLITAQGEEALCQICADHPRFRNAFTDRTEIGLGLCCEAAARLVLTSKEPMRLVCLEENGASEPLTAEENALLTLRAALIDRMQDETCPLAERLDDLLGAVDFTLPDLDWVAEYRQLERLDPHWDDVLDRFAPTAPFRADLAPMLTRFAVYLLYRHLPGALEDEDLPGRVAFCVLSTQMLSALCASLPAPTPDDCIELARMYSAEIEYSQENIDALLDALYSGSAE